MTEPAPAASAERRMRLRYGVNEADSWWYFALGPHRERLWGRLNEMNTQIIRIFVFDKCAPDPVTAWDDFRAYVDAVLNVGAVPMVTFAKSHRPTDDPRGLRWFATRCADVVWNAQEEWGAERIREWYWCIWNEPNSTWIGGGLSFEQYRRVYEEVAHAMLRWLGTAPTGQRPLIGGPAVEGFQPFWIDWVSRFLTEVDPALIGFVNWHRYADWRDHGEKGAPRDEAIHRALMLAQTADYQLRAQAVADLVETPGILNVCGEWNAHSHYLPPVRARFNQSMFGAAYGAAALLHLLRGGADAEMLWTGTDEACGYGILDSEARPTPLFHTKRFFGRYVRYGDWISFPVPDNDRLAVDGVVARGEDGRRSGLFVHLDDRSATYDVGQLAGDRLSDCATLLKLDAGTDHHVRMKPATGTVDFDGYGIAVLTNALDAEDE
jgi:hypothetical protein